MSDRGPRSALLVGTGVPSPDGGPAPSANDVEAVRDILLRRFDFVPEEVRTLAGPSATRAGILGALDTLAASCPPDGTVVVYFSGHGAVLPGRDDTWGSDAALEPYGATSRADLITDDVLFGWIERLWDRTSGIHLVIDSCFSGGLDSDDFGDARGDHPGSGRPYGGGSGWPVDHRYALLASSRHSLESATVTLPELGNRPQSLFTACLATLLTASGGPLPTYAELRTLLDARSAAFGTPQQPQASGDVNREFLGAVRRPSRRLVRLGGPDALRVGTAHGVVAGSRWAVVPTAGSGASTPGAGGDLEVVTPLALRSTCRRLTEHAGPAAPRRAERDVVAVEVMRPPGPGRLPVVLQHAEWLAGPPPAALVTALTDRLSASPLLDVAPGLAPGTFRPGGADSRITVAVSDAYLTVICDDLLVTRLHDGTRPDTPDLLAQDLEEIARWTWAREAAGDAVPADVAAGVTLRLFRRSATAPEAPAPEAPVDGFDEVGAGTPDEPPHLACGDVVAARIDNRSDRAVFVALFHLGVDRTVVRLFPHTPQSNALGPGESRSWGFHGRSGWSVDRVAHGNDLRWPQPRRQAFKLWVTADETDLGVVEAAPAVARAAGVVPLYGAGVGAVSLRALPLRTGAEPAPGTAWWATVAREYLVDAPA